jgi:sigma-B regulation protein RsbQ
LTQNILARNNVKVFGKGTQPMLFAHGFGCDQNMWRFVTPAFEDDYRIILLTTSAREGRTYRLTAPSVTAI